MGRLVLLLLQANFLSFFEISSVVDQKISHRPMWVLKTHILISVKLFSTLTASNNNLAQIWFKYCILPCFAQNRDWWWALVNVVMNLLLGKFKYGMLKIKINIFGRWTKENKFVFHYHPFILIPHRHKKLSNIIADINEIHDHSVPVTLLQYLFSLWFIHHTNETYKLAESFSMIQTSLKFRKYYL
jgi:hypothetical protein